MHVATIKGTYLGADGSDIDVEHFPLSFLEQLIWIARSHPRHVRPLSVGFLDGLVHVARVERERFPVLCGDRV